MAVVCGGGEDHGVWFVQVRVDGVFEPRPKLDNGVGVHIGFV